MTIYKVSMRDPSHPNGYPIVHTASKVETTPGWLTFTTTHGTYTVPSRDVILVRTEEEGQ